MNKKRELIMKRIEYLVKEKEYITQIMLGMNMEERRDWMLRKEAIVDELKQYISPSKEQYSGKTRAYQ